MNDKEFVRPRRRIVELPINNVERCERAELREIEEHEKRQRARGTRFSTEGPCIDCGRSEGACRCKQIRSEYNALNLASRTVLEAEYLRHHKVADTRGVKKDMLVVCILLARHGFTRVRAAIRN